jgi:hypothetical protein
MLAVDLSYISYNFTSWTGKPFKRSEKCLRILLFMPSVYAIIKHNKIPECMVLKSE